MCTLGQAIYFLYVAILLGPVGLM